MVALVARVRNQRPTRQDLKSGLGQGSPLRASEPHACFSRNRSFLELSFHQEDVGILKFQCPVLSWLVHQTNQAPSRTVRRHSDKPSSAHSTSADFSSLQARFVLCTERSFRGRLRSRGKPFSRPLRTVLHGLLRVEDGHRGRLVTAQGPELRIRQIAGIPSYRGAPIPGNCLIEPGDSGGPILRTNAGDEGVLPVPRK
jgi:hypothetical protein